MDSSRQPPPVTRYGLLGFLRPYWFRLALVLGVLVLTTIFGLLPMAVGSSSFIGMPYAPLGRTMMGGLLASTVLTLVIVPLCYTYFDDLRTLAQRVMGSSVHRSHPVSGGADETSSEDDGAQTPV